MKTRIKDSDLHPRIIKRMEERGVAKKEIEETIEKGTKVDVRGSVPWVKFIFSHIERDG